MNSSPAPPFSDYVATGDWVGAVGFTVTAYALVYEFSDLPDAWKRWLLTPFRHPLLWLVTVFGINLAPLLVATLWYARQWSPATSQLVAAPVTLLCAALGTWLLLSRLTLERATRVTVDGIRGGSLSDKRRGDETADLLVLVVTSILKEKDPGTIRRQASQAIRWVKREGRRADQHSLGEVVKRCIAVLGNEAVNGARPSIAHIAAYLSVVLTFRTVGREEAAKWGFERLWSMLDPASGAAPASSPEPKDPAVDKAWTDLIRKTDEFETPADFERLENWTTRLIHSKFRKRSETVT